MVKSNIVNPQQQPTIPEAVSALLHFMQQQMATNQDVRNNLLWVEKSVYEPLVTARNASKHTCVEAIM